MALPKPAGLVPSEVAFLCEMELITIVPRQRFESVDLLSVSVAHGVFGRVECAFSLTGRAGCHTSPTSPSQEQCSIMVGNSSEETTAS